MTTARGGKSSLSLTKLIEESDTLPGPLMMQVCLEGDGAGLAPAPARKASGAAERMRRYRARKILYRQLLKARSLGLPISDAVALLHAAWQSDPPKNCPRRFSA